MKSLFGAISARSDMLRMRLKIEANFRSMVQVIICLSMIISILKPVVLCIGNDGHVQLESAGHTQCHDPSYFQSSDHNQLSFESNAHEKGKHCEPCIDIPLLANDFSKQLNSIPKKPLPFKILPKIIISVSDIDSLSTHEEFITKHSEPISYPLTSIRTTVLII